VKNSYPVAKPCPEPPLRLGNKGDLGHKDKGTHAMVNCLCHKTHVNLCLSAARDTGEKIALKPLAHGGDHRVYNLCLLVCEIRGKIRIHRITKGIPENLALHDTEIACLEKKIDQPGGCGDLFLKPLEGNLSPLLDHIKNLFSLYGETLSIPFCAAT